MFSKLFRKKGPYSKIQAETDSLRFLGAPTGEGLRALEEELIVILESEGNSAKAYLSKVQYPKEERIRVAIVIEGKVSADKMAPIIAKDCHEVTGIDLTFFEHLPENLIKKVMDELTPFYVAKKYNKAQQSGM